MPPFLEDKIDYITLFREARHTFDSTRGLAAFPVVQGHCYDHREILSLQNNPGVLG